MWEILVPVAWVSLAVYTLWYFVVAKDYAPLNPKEVLLLWKIHKHNTRCKAKEWHEIRRGNKIVGFKCDCGYKHLQKRPITVTEPVFFIPSEATLRGQVKK